MKRIRILLFLLAPLSIFSAPFQNLNFEQANTNSLRLDRSLDALVGPVTDLLTGWRAFQGPNQFTSIAYNGSLAFFEKGGGPTIIGGRPFYGLPPPPPIEGGFSFAFEFRGGIAEPLTLVQRGDIPADARFLVFTHSSLLMTPSVSIDGTTLFQPFGSIAYPATLSLDVSQFAGMNVELQFSTSRNLGAGTYEFDNIAFLVPEPSTTALLTAGALAFIVRSLWLRKPKTGRNA